MTPRNAFRLGMAPLLAVLSVWACVRPEPRLGTPEEAAEANPLGASYVLMPLPTEDPSLLGRILHQRPQAGRSLNEFARPNPCAEHLGTPRTTPLASRFEDAEELTQGAAAGAVLSGFGFSAEARSASHFFYRLETTKRMARIDTNEYVACCKENDCGYGFVSELVYGQGEYAAASEASGGARADLAIASASGFTSLRVLKRRNVRGWLAAVVTVTDRDKVGDFGLLGLAKKAGVKVDSLPAAIRDVYENDKITLSGRGEAYVFKDGSGKILTENEFVERFRNTTGSDELDDVEGRRNWPGVITWGGLAAISGVLVAYPFLSAEDKCTHSVSSTSGGLRGKG